MRKLFNLSFFLLCIVGTSFSQSETYTCPNGASVTATANSYTSTGGGTQCNVSVTLSSTIFNTGQRTNYVGLGNPSFTSNLFNGNFGGTFPNTTSNTGIITINLSCDDVDTGVIEVRQGGTSGTICGSLLLPVELTAFIGEANAETVRLLWETSSEVNNAGFDIERSRDGVVFTSLGSVAGNGTSQVTQQYSFVDEQPLTGVNYYRLRQIDLDGSETFHAVIAVLFGTQDTDRTLTIFPTVVSDQLQVALNQELRTVSELYVSTLLGRIVLRKSLADGEQQTSLDVQTLVKGQYILMLKSGNMVKTARFVKQ